MPDNDYDRMLAEIDGVLAKAMPVEDDKDVDAAIAAAAEGKDMPHDDEEDKDKDGVPDDADPAAMMKSFAVTLASGEETEAYDATELLKGMHAVSSSQSKAIAQLRATVDAQGKVLARIPEALAAVQRGIESQGAVLKSLRAAPAGRRSTTVAPAKSDTGATDGRSDAEAVLTKCLALQRDGSLNANDVAMVEARLGRGMSLPAHVTQALAAAR